MSYYDNKKLTVINFLGGPGTGKSTTSAGLFNLMKRDYRNVELVTEYAKDLVWSERSNMFTEQDYIFAKQNHRLRRLVGKVDIAISDSPLVLGLIYKEKDYPLSFAPFVKETFDSYNNINIYLKRNHPYQALGRNQDESGSDRVAAEIKEFLTTYRIPFTEVETSEDTHLEVYEAVKQLLPPHEVNKEIKNRL